MKMTHWQWRAATKQLDRVCPAQLMHKGRYCPVCDWDANRDVAIKFVIE